MVNLGSYFNYAVPMGKHQLTAVSLFAGVGGFDLALERAGVKVVAAVEIDKNARGVLAKQFPNTQLFNDVTTVTGKDLRDAGFIPDYGIITGGFPCQDLSVAGKRAGLAGQRSGLYWQIVRLVEELSPKYLILENVPGLLSSNGGKDMGTVIGSLTDRGYGVGWRVLDAQYFGVAQRRRRVFIVASLGDDGAAPGEILALCEGLSGDTPSRKSKGQDPAGDVGSSFKKPMLLTQREGKSGGGKGPLISIDQSLTLATQNSQVLYEPVGTLTANGFRCDLNKAQSGHLTVGPVAFDEMNFTTSEKHQTLGAGTPQSTGVLEPKPANGGEIMNCLPAELYHHGTVVNQDVNSGHLVIEPEPVIVGPLTALGMANAKGTETTDSHHYVLEPTLISPTLTAYNMDSRSPQSEESQRIVGSVLNATGTVRRLTPTECERLQGFPDGWTAERIDEVKGLVTQADSSRYKQMGNAVAVPCVEWIVNRLVAYEQVR